MTQDIVYPEQTVEDMVGGAPATDLQFVASPELTFEPDDDEDVPADEEDE